MCESYTYNGWANRETWAFMLHINNDEALRDGALEAVTPYVQSAGLAADSLREYADSLFTRVGWVDTFGGSWPDALADASSDIGSLHRIDWQECAESLLADIAEYAEA